MNFDVDNFAVLALAGPPLAFVFWCYQGEGSLTTRL